MSFVPTGAHGSIGTMGNCNWGYSLRIKILDSHVTFKDSGLFLHAGTIYGVGPVCGIGGRKGLKPQCQGSVSWTKGVGMVGITVC